MFKVASFKSMVLLLTIGTNHGIIRVSTTKGRIVVGIYDGGCVGSDFLLNKWRIDTTNVGHKIEKQYLTVNVMVAVVQTFE